MLSARKVGPVALRIGEVGDSLDEVDGVLAALSSLLTEEMEAWRGIAAGRLERNE